MYFDIGMKNEANYKVSFYSGVIDKKYEIVYPDTSLPHTPRLIEQEFTDVNRGTWKYEFKHHIPNDTLSFFIFHQDTLNKYPWGTIRKEYMILQRYDLSWQDLKVLNYEFFFPPTEIMSQMKMYPPYGTYNANGSLKEK